MTLEADLVAWANTRPGWQRDVLVRLCHREPFDEAAIVAIADRLLAGEAASPGKLSTADIPGNTVAAGGVQLIALRDLTGVNALATDQRLTFGEPGLTIMYGDNASGKTGYARVLKAAVGAQVREDILGDVFAKSGLGAQSAVVEYQVANVGSVQEWRWPGTPSPQLQQVHFYDEAGGDAYLTAESEITYRPSSLILLDQLIRVCDAVRGVLEQRLRDLNATKQSMPVVPDDTPASRFLAGLKPETTDAEITSACELPEDANETLGRLLAEEARLKASDPRKERNRLAALAGSFDTVAAYFGRLAAVLTGEAIDEFVKLRTTATELRAAATVASSQDFRAEPVLGVGSAAWRELWEAARAFCEAEAYHDHAFPVTDNGARCVLCQQELSTEAGDRMRRFHAFMTDSTERDAANAEQACTAAQRSVQELKQIPPTVVTAIAEVGGADAAMADAANEWLSAATAQAAAVVNLLDSAATVPPAPVTVALGKALSDRSQRLRDQAAAIDAATFAQQLRSISTQVATLQGQVALAASQHTISAELRRLQARVRIDVAKKATDTGPITRKASELTRDHVTREVRDQFTRESERLQLQRITLDDTSGVKGRLLHRPALLGAAQSASVTKVLSEGEQTALGLSGFFTEVVFDATKSGLVLDDPVTSLDHIRRARVAQRLVELAADRQVVVFTHEVTFVGDLVRYADEAKVPVAERWVQRNGGLLGVCTDKHPWKAKDVKARIGALEADLARIKKNRSAWDQEEYEEHCASWAGKLSEAWERAVHLEIVNEVVDRGTSEVRPKKFRILSAITEHDDTELQAGYGNCSLWARRHDKAPGVNFVAPEPADLEAELQRFRDWFKRIKSYRES